MKTSTKISIMEAGCLLFCLIFSFINHFLFEWSDKFVLFAPFVPVNESVWEHGKLLFMPFLFYSIIEYFFFPYKNNFIFAKSLSLVLSFPLMIIIFYTYSGIIGKNFLLADISISVLIVMFMNFLSYKQIISKKSSNKKIVSLVILFFIMFFVFTFYQPHIDLFMNTPNGLYGII